MSAMTDSTVPTERRTLVPALLLGGAIALAFALVTRLVPESVLVDTGPRVALYAVLALSAPLIVLPLRALAERLAVDPRSFVWAAIGGALLFDGTALGFAPDLYGQTGDATARVAAALLWAFGWQAVTQLFVERRRPSDLVGRLATPGR